MAGYTDALVVELPVFWWPPLGALPHYPVHPSTSFAAALAAEARSWPAAAEASALESVGLSRLGRSIMMTASWSCEQDAGDAAPQSAFVKVWNPMDGLHVHLPVSVEAGLGAVHAAGRTTAAARSRSGPQVTNVALTELSLTELTRSGRVRLARHSVVEALRCCCRSRDDLLAYVQRRAAPHAAYALLHRRVTQAHAAAWRHLRRIAQSVRGTVCTPAGALRAPAAGPPSPASTCSLLFAGDAPSQRHLLRLLRATTPPVVQVVAGQAFALEVRCLNFAEVLTLREGEALEAVEAVLRPPPVAAGAPLAPPLPLSPCLVLVLESLHLLAANANSLVAAVTHHLCHCLDALNTGAVPAVVWSFAEEARDVPAALVARVGAQQVAVGTVTAEDRSAFLLRRLRPLLQQRRTAPLAGVASGDNVHTAAAALAEHTAHWTVDRLVRFPDAGLEAMAAAEQHPAVPLAGPSAPAVYDRLYGVGEAVDKVEELVVWPLTHLDLLRDLAIPCAKGVLLCGPSGSGKTALLACLARRLRLPDARRVHVMSVDGLSLVEKEVGRSEKNIARLFAAARALAPTALFIDNLDSLAPPRGRTTAETNTTGDRTLSTLLTQMDGVSGVSGTAAAAADGVVVVVASAPSLDSLDPAVRRPGRLDVHVQLAAPPAEASASFMKRRLHDFIAHVQQRGHTQDSEGSAAAAAANARVEQLVDEYIASVSRGAPAAGDTTVPAAQHPPAPSTALLSPAEVSAALREVMLWAAEQLAALAPQDACATEAATAVKEGDVVRAVHDALGRLHASVPPLDKAQR